VWDTLKDSTAAKALEAVKDSLFDSVKGAWDAMKDGDVKKALAIAAAAGWDAMKAAWDAIKDTKVGKTLQAIKDKAFDGLKSGWDSIKSKTETLTGEAKNSASSVLSTLKSGWDSIKTKTATVTGKAVNKGAKTLKTLRSGWDALKSKTVELTAKFNDIFTSPLKKAWNAIAKAVNGAISTINKIPGVNIKGKLPTLAQGGYAKKNTPQLAVIGDNRHQGEVVAPESKMLEMAKQAASMVGGSRDAEIISLLKQILAALNALNLVATIDGNSAKKLIVKLINEHTRATGVCEIEI
jgi:hypothetical protein